MSQSADKSWLESRRQEVLAACRKARAGLRRGDSVEQARIARAQVLIETALVTAMEDDAPIAPHVDNFWQRVAALSPKD